MAPTIFSRHNLFCLFVGSQEKLKHVAKDPPSKGTAIYDDYVASNCSVMTWLLSNMDEKVNASVMFLKTAKEIWDTLKEIIPTAEYFLCC